MNTYWQTTRAWGTALLAMVAFAPDFRGAAAADYPTRPIRLVNPYAAGGPVDQIARVVAEGLSAELGQRVMVDVKAGGGTVIGAADVARAAPDGYTLLLGTQAPLILQPAINSKLPYQPERDFAPVAMFTTVPGLISVATAEPVQTLRDLIDLAKKQPGKINYASAGVGTGSHLGGELFNRMAGVQLNHVPYKGAAPATVAMVSREVNVGFVNITPQLPHVKAGRLRPLAITSAKRSPALPDVPTVDEAGRLRGYVADSWYGLFAPAGTPKPVIDKLYQALTTVMAKAETKSRPLILGGADSVMAPAQFGAYVKAHRNRLAPIIKSIDLKPE
jgi:tripartite-type tricarboxylate transporter receptor subunit TctC